MSSMKPRLITAAIGLPFAVFVLIMSEYFSWVLTAAISILCVFMTFEILSAKKLHNDIKIVLPSVIFAFAQPLLCGTPYGLFPLYFFITIMFFLMIANHKKISFTEIAFIIATISVIVFGITSILMLSAYYKGYISFAFVICVGVPWIADGGAYFAGVFLGKHKLCPNISPNKTIEGFIGGMFFGAVSAPLIGLIFTFIYRNFAVNYYMLLIIGFLESLISVLGDLSFSLIKRSCNIKDYGSIFPGHGGILDRFDSVIFVAPLVYILSTVLQVVLV